MPELRAGDTVIVVPLWGGSFAATVAHVGDGFVLVVRTDKRLQSAQWVLSEQIVAVWPQEVIA